MRSILLLGWLVSIGAINAAAEDETLARFNEVARLAEEERSHDKGPESNRHLAPIMDGLVSDSITIRDRAVELMMPCIQKGWIAVDQFERIGWEKLDARGKGLYLWCAASRRCWNTEHRSVPLNADAVCNLWSLAVQEPIALPFLKEIAVRWFMERTTDLPTIRLGEGLRADARERIARQFLSTFGSCTTPRERLSVIWMILDLHTVVGDTALIEWYSTQTDTALRVSLLGAIYHAIQMPGLKDDSEEGDVTRKSKDAIRARIPVILSLVELAEKDWHAEAVEAAKRVKKAIEALQSKQ